MTQYTPIYRIPVPDNATKARDLGDALLNMGLGVENALGEAGIPAPSGGIKQLVRQIKGTIVGAISASGTEVAMIPVQTIPASPLGVGVKYRLVVKAYILVSMATGTGNVNVRTAIDGAVSQVMTSDYAPTNGSEFVNSWTEAEALITNPDVTHTVGASITRAGAAATAQANGANDQKNQGVVIRIEAYDTF